MICWLRSTTIAMIGSPAARNTTDATDWSFRSLAPPARSPAAIVVAGLAISKYADCDQIRLGFGLPN